MSRKLVMAVAATVALGQAACQTMQTPAPVARARPAQPVRVVRAPPPPPPVVAPRRCVPRNLSPEPRYPDTDQALLSAGGAADRYQLIAAGRLLRMDRLSTLEKIVAGCR